MWVLSALRGRFTRAPSLSPAAARLAQEQGALVLDVREAHEFGAGHIPKARHLPLSQLSDGLGGLPSGVHIVTVCRVGRRSALAASRLRRAGYDVATLEGGLLAWSAAGLPVVSRAGRVGQIV
ncbi:MAG: Rhodanese domain protein [Friedmanniella sp.]|nr:Rhodanese domain protein [Friedmanniella sp.]